MSEDQPRVTIIHLGGESTECVCCEREIDPGYGIAVYEGEALPVDYEGEWGGFPACRVAFDWAESLEAPAPFNQSPCVSSPEVAPGNAGGGDQ